MRLRVLLATLTTVVASAGIVATPASAAAAADQVKRISCRSNANHYTDSDLFLRTASGDKVLIEVSWHTHANFRPDRIAWSARNPDTGAFTVVGAVGASQDTLNDVPYLGNTSILYARAADAYRMSVFDSAFGNCSVTWSW